MLTMVLGPGRGRRDGGGGWGAGGCVVRHALPKDSRAAHHERGGAGSGQAQHERGSWGQNVGGVEAWWWCEELFWVAG